MRAELPPLYLTAGVRALETEALSRDPSAHLMERAGLAAAEFARELTGETGRSVLVLAGPGNNGGDAFEAATHLKRWFYRVDVVFSGDASKLPHDAAAALAVHLSRMAEDLVLWCSPGFGWYGAPDGFSTGSSAASRAKASQPAGATWWNTTGPARAIRLFGVRTLESAGTASIATQQSQRPAS